MEQGTYFVGMIGKVFVHGRIIMNQTNIYLCQNQKDGSRPSDNYSRPSGLLLYGYRFSWVVYRSQVEFNDGYIRGVDPSGRLIFLFTYEI